MKQLHLFTWGFFRLSACKDEPESEGLSVAELCPVTTAEGKIWSSSETPKDVQVGMSSHKALSVSDLKRRRESGRWKERDKKAERGYFQREKMDC